MNVLGASPKPISITIHPTSKTVFCDDKKQSKNFLNGFRYAGCYAR